MDKNGSYAIRPQFVHAESFQEGLALVQTTWGLNLLGKTEGVYLFGRVGYIDLSGKFVIGSRFAENARGFSEGLAAFQPGASSWGNAKWGYLDKAGKWAIKPRFEIATDFSEDLAAVQLSQGMDAAGKELAKWGYIDHAGQLVIPPQFDGAMPFNNGIAIVRTQPPPGYHIHPARCIDKQGKFMAKCPSTRNSDRLGETRMEAALTADSSSPGTHCSSGFSCRRSMSSDKSPYHSSTLIRYLAGI